MVFRRDDAVADMYLVRRGLVRLVRHGIDGADLTMQRAGPGCLLAEASLFAERYHCDAICGEETAIAFVPRADLLARLADGGYAIAALAHASREIQTLRARVEIMRMRRLGARLDAYLAIQDPPPPGGWAQVADWIGVTPPALYRELARRRGRLR